MRIQHNISAMSAYRHYNNNTSSLSKNLEKLSSGYKINRAGDDAAGLAISEKMRAQITGLEVAQKNAKDGISLIQTAEGALTEVHSMLNRMYELAEQSANGTYDDDVDRTQLQKEVEQLRTEINRISDASNFNGIKLLDGSLNAADILTVTPGGSVNVPILPEDETTHSFEEVGQKTILKGEETQALTTEFTVNMQNVLIQNAQIGDELTMTIGEDVTLTLTVSADGAAVNEISAADAANTDKIADKFAQLFADAAGAENKIQEQAFTATVSGHEIAFVQAKAPTSAKEIVDAEVPVTITYTPVPTEATRMRAANYRMTRETSDPPQYEAEVKNIQNLAVGNKITNLDVKVPDVGEDFYNVTKNGTTVLLNISGNTTAKTISATLNLSSVAIQKIELTGATGTVTGDATSVSTDGAGDLSNGKLTVTLVDGTQIDVSGNFESWDRTAANGILFYMQPKPKPVDPPDPVDPPVDPVDPPVDPIDPPVDPIDPPDPVPTKGTGLGVGSYNVSTTKNQQGAMYTPERLASTTIDLKETFAKDGGMLTIGKETYVFHVGDNSLVRAEHGQKLLTISDADLARFGGDVIDAIGEQLSQQNNSAFDLGYDKNANTLSIHEKIGQTDYDSELKNHNAFQSLIAAETQTITTVTKGDGTSLTLQIGDTAETFNKLVVDIKACTAHAMGIGNIDIATQDGASRAMTAIKNAINYVSDVRGDLGSTQNRLDHTINNLSVMQENIQDAESTIRDVDVAKEMMAYTKNNILVQSAQAMLAQAHQLPQGVLQLLQ